MVEHDQTTKLITVVPIYCLVAILLTIVVGSGSIGSDAQGGVMLGLVAFAATGVSSACFIAAICFCLVPGWYRKNTARFYGILVLSGLTPLAYFLTFYVFGPNM
jgi:hypothetical protein